MSGNLKIAVAQLNPIVGDLKGNCDKILTAWEKARDAGADVLMTTEFSLTGYPLEDLVEIRDFLKAVKNRIDFLVAQTVEGPAVLVGAPHWDGVDEDSNRLRIYNAVFVLDRGEIIEIVKKTELPNYGVFDEKRNFTANELSSVVPVTVRGHRLGIMICEDTWAARVSCKLADEGAAVLLSLNASPYEQGKSHIRYEKVACRRAQETGLDLIYSNQVGGQDELVFDGGSFAVACDKDGAPVKTFAARLMQEDFAVLTLENLSGRLVIQKDSKNMRPQPEPLEELYQALMLGTRDYVRKTGFEHVVIGLSGGIDSGLVAAIAVDALGADKVHLVRLPSQYTSDMSNDDADLQAEFLGVSDIREIAIAKPVAAIEDALAASFKGLAPDVTEENIQSRARGLLLMALSNKFNWMLLTTGNKSELSVGYCTLYGDTNGGFNPIKDVYKTKVRALSDWRNEHVPEGALGPRDLKMDKAAGRKAMVMPWNIITRPPSAELREGQEDSQSLPDYDILDAILERRLEGGQSRDEIIDAGFDEAQVDRILHLMKIAIYKQNQAPPGVKTTRRAVRGRDLRLPIANKFNPADPKPAEMEVSDETRRKARESR